MPPSGEAATGMPMTGFGGADEHFASFGLQSVHQFRRTFRRAVRGRDSKEVGNIEALQDFGTGADHRLVGGGPHENGDLGFHLCKSPQSFCTDVGAMLTLVHVNEGYRFIGVFLRFRKA